MKYFFIMLTITILLVSCEKQASFVACDKSIIENLNMEPSEGLDIGCRLYLSREEYILGVAYRQGNHCMDLTVPLLNCNGESLSTSDEKSLGEFVSSEIIGVRPK